MIQMTAETRRAELRRVARFALVGITVAALYALLFFLFRELGLVRWAANFLAFGLAVSFQYVAQTLFTFRAALRSKGQPPKFLATIGLGLMLSTLIAAVLGPALGWPDSVSVLVVTVVLPVTNFLLFRLWVYRAGGDAG